MNETEAKPAPEAAPAWELLIDGHCRGRYTGPSAPVNAADAVPAIMAEYPPEHPHPGDDDAA